MKRIGKCVNKKAYAYHSDAEEAAIKSFKKYGTYLKVYECPTCLDFHLSSKRVDQPTRHRLDLQIGKQGNAKTRRGNERKKRNKACLKAINTLTIDFFSYPQPRSFWSRILGIMIGVGK